MTISKIKTANNIQESEMKNQAKDFRLFFFETATIFIRWGDSSQTANHYVDINWKNNTVN
jgi:hypothetical protein